MIASPETQQCTPGPLKGSPRIACSPRNIAQQAARPHTQTNQKRRSIRTHIQPRTIFCAYRLAIQATCSFPSHDDNSAQPRHKYPRSEQSSKYTRATTSLLKYRRHIHTAWLCGQVVLSFPPKFNQSSNQHSQTTSQPASTC